MSSLLKNVADFLTPVLTTSAFASTGVLTPDEFVSAGDQLVHACATWSWGHAVKGSEKAYLPQNKQFIFTRNVPCRMRAVTLDRAAEATRERLVEAGEEEGEEGEGGEEEGWVATEGVQSEQKSSTEAEIMTDIDAPSSSSSSSSATNQPQKAAAEEEEQEEEEIQDIDDVQDDDLLDTRASHLKLDDEDDDAALRTHPPSSASSSSSSSSSSYLTASEPTDNIMRTRSYDLSIVYDKFYRVPRLYLFGYDEHRQPLTSTQMFEDISSEHALKTVTIEPQPFMNPSIAHASIHPCKHAAVMKRLVDAMTSQDGRKFEAKDSMFVFLKFMTAVIPTIEYDFTMN